MDDYSELASEPIAIIGMSCKFSGGVTDPETLWDLLASGRTGWSEIPEERFNLKGVYHPNNERIATSHVKGAHFIQEDVTSFDAAFFNYSGETAQALDPQFRLQLESTFEALENAGLTMDQVAGSQTSVFAGVFTHDYHEALVRDEDRLPRFMLVGTWNPMSSNRISHFFDFRGASMTLETGCSTTLVALHQAVQSLRNREADMSVVTGVNLILGPDQFKAIGSLGMLSPDGKSYAFDRRANGYGRGEGVATILIKRLSDALAANDPIRAVIRETALNQDGKTETITTPSGAAQETLMRECYRRAGLDPRGTQYFEAHGTGTQAGDPIEARAMAGVFCGVGEDGTGGRDEAHYLRIGSVKTNVGHTEAASGLAAVIKGVLCLERGLIPPSVNYETPNPKLKLDEWRLKVVTAMEPWPESLIGGPKRLSVNNFGYGGSNAHVIMESAEPWTSTPTLPLSANGTLNGNGHVNGNGYTNGNGNGISNGHVNGNGNGITKGYLNGNGHVNGTHKTASSKVLVLSARDERGGQRMVEDLKTYLEKHKSLDFEAAETLLRDLSYTLAERRTLFPWVAAHQVRLDTETDNHPLDAVIEAFDSPRFKPGKTPTGQPRIGMVFTGQGAQWNAMGRELLEEYPVYRQSIEEAEAHLKDLGATWSLLEELQRDPKTTKVHATSISIPVCVAVQIALVRLLKSWGIKPAAVTSHSSGEISAAYAVGALTHRQAMATAYYRAILAAEESARVSGPQKGGMAAVGLGADEAQEYLDRVADVGKVVIACVNSPQSVTVSGDNDAVAAVEALCKDEGVFARKLKVEQAYHSHHMDPLADAYHELLRKEMARTAIKTLEAETEELEDGELKVIFSSAVTGGRITDAKEIADPDHWVGSLVQPVLFVDAFTDMVLGETEDASGRNIDVVLEVGPHTALGGPIREIMSLVEFDGIELPYWGALVRNEHAGDTMRTAAINLLKEGLPVVMSEINFPKPSSSDRWHLYDDDLPRVLTDLPTYPWNHSIRHWQEARVNYAIRNRSQPPHDLLGMPVPGTDPDTAVWRRSVRVSEVPWVRDHMVQGSIVWPGSGYVCLAIEAANQLARADGHGDNISGFRLRDVDFMAALVIPDADGVEIRTTVRPVPERELGLQGWRRWEVSTVTQENQWKLHAQGLVTVELTKEGDVEENSGGLRPLSAYTRHKDPRDMFAHLRARGVYHGPLFQNTTKIVQDGREPRSITDVTIRYESAADTDPVAAAQESVIHPITLDAVVVSFFSALPGVGAQVEDPRLPRSIESMWVSSRISREDGHTLRCDTSLSHDDPQGGRADVIVVDGQTGVTVLEIQGLACSSLGRGSGAMARQGANGTQANDWEQDVCSKVEWAADLSLQQPAALAQIKEELAGEAGVSTDVVSNLSRAVVYYAEETLKTVTADDVNQLKDQQPHLVEYYAWLSQLVTQSDSQKWLLDSPEERQKHFAVVASQGVDGELISRIGPIIESILLGESNPLVAMAKDGLLHRYYANSVRLAPSLTRLSTLVRKVAHKNPAARVLQIGAGIGAAATRTLLEAIGTPKTSVVGGWHITEPSTDVLEDTQTELADWADFLEFSVLDVNRDPSKQSFTLESFDIVVCYQSLHTVEDVAGTLAHVRNLLKPGGKLLLAETTPDQSKTDLSFILGLLPTPASSQPVSWDNVLRESGFSGADLAIDDVTTTILSTRPLVENQKADLSRASNPGGFAIDLTKTTVCVFVGDIDEPTLLTDLDAVRIEGLRAMVTKCGGLLWITTGGAVESERPEQALAQGFLRVLRNEYVGRRYLYLDLDPRAENTTEDTVSTIVQVLQEGFGQVQDVLATETGPAEFEYAQRNGVLLIPRVYKDEEYNDMVTGPLTPIWGDLDAAAGGIPLEPLFQQNRTLRLEVGIPGHLDTLAFVDDEGDDDTESFGPESIEITPRAFGLSSRDVMAALGQLKDRSIGLECAGIISRVGEEAHTKGGFNVGDRVMALLPGSGTASLRNNITVPWNGGIVKVPSSITSFEEAASVPLAFTIAYAGLVDAARLAPGQSVLIHAAAGAIGQAAIMLAKYLGVTDIYATAGTPEKRELVSKKYGIPAQRIFSSRDVSFGPAVLAATGRRGVDVVLNTLPGILLQASLDALAPLGHLVEIGKRDIEANGLLALAAFSRGISLTALDIPTLVQRRPADVHRVLSEVAKLVEQQALTPIYPVTTYPLPEIQEAFKFVETGAHTGKVVLSAGPDEQAPVVPRPKHATGRLRLRPDASYLVVGGIGGIGRSIAHWLVAHGAKNLILLSRSAGNLDLPENKDTNGSLFVQELHDGLPPVRGVVQGAMLLRDAIFEQMTLADWHGGLRPKVDGTWNLHTEFAAPNTLDFFVMLSSVSGVLGIASQTNYAAGGSYEDAMAKWRQSKGLPGVSIDLGPIADVGYVAETAKVAERLRKSGDYVMLDENTVLRAFAAAVARPLGSRHQIIVGLNAGPGPQWDAHGGSQLGRDARYVNLKPHVKVSRAGGGDTAGGKVSLASQLSEAGSRDEAARIVGDAIADKLASIFMIDVADIDLSKKPAGYGVDSLIAVELRNMLVLQAGADVSIFNILQAASLAALAADVAAKSSHVQAAA
ncbi:polyketide synthase dehydratase domain-containing protein [Trichoderma breve]|uniref:Polyketide synthase dehydratase domain-containing protein n=1 Tax=Trichoderma breve TaxID=2034170 RepID=A0A9W9BHQ1_9HYPO|nr:polyketide synthase dehydratase domain-containing protein [Trichoderma breve]KAJ4862469.1 polyketide synthase dehydratase domain-containing protein [Trichoderma breve]